jgi:hypothetical protein
VAVCLFPFLRILWPDVKKIDRLPSRSVLFLVIILATILRSLGPYLPQSGGDSLLYIAMAMKLRNFGFDHFNLRGIEVKKVVVDSISHEQILELKPSIESDPEGDLIRDLKERHLGYYDLPYVFFYKPYGFPLALTAVHMFLGNSPRENWHLLDTAYRPDDLLVYRPWKLARQQWRWLLLPFLSSLGCVILTYLLAKKWFGETTGLWASFLLAIYPVDILTSQRIWADDLNLFFILLGFYFVLRATERDSLGSSLIAGISFGLAYLCKQISLFFLFGFILSELWFAKSESERSRSFAKVWTVCAFGFLMIVAHSNILILEHWSHLFALPSIREDVIYNPWEQWLLHRPHPLILYSIGLAVLCPALLLAGIHYKNRHIQKILMITALFFFSLICVKGKEYRYFLPVIPFLLISCGHAMETLSRKRVWIPWTLAIGQLLWSVYLTYQFTWQNWGEIPIPF